MFRDIYAKVSYKNQYKKYYDLSRDNIETIYKNLPDEPKLADINTDINTIDNPNAIMMYENVIIDEDLLPNKKGRKKSHTKEYFCEICNYKTFIKCNYNKHILSSLHKKINKIKSNNAFCCKICDYSTNRKNDYDKHMDTKKHIQNVKEKEEQMCKEEEEENNKNIVNVELFKNEVISTLMNQFSSILEENNKSVLAEQTKLMIESQTKLMDEQCKMNKMITDIANKTTNTNSITNNNNHNQTNNQQFNLNMFLNETCKDAMNLSEFLENMHVSMEDMEKTGELGFAKGMSRIIMNNLNAIDVCKRPIHCSDVKRETLYVKNNGVWEKETEDRKRTKEIIYKASRLNLKELLKWRDLPRNKGYDKSDHTKNDEFTNLVMEINKMREEEFDKIITSVSKHVAIDKEKVKMSGYLN